MGKKEVSAKLNTKLMVNSFCFQTLFTEGAFFLSIFWPILQGDTEKPMNRYYQHHHKMGMSVACAMLSVSLDERKKRAIPTRLLRHFPTILRV